MSAAMKQRIQAAYDAAPRCDTLSPATPRQLAEWQRMHDRDAAELARHEADELADNPLRGCSCGLWALCSASARTTRP